MTTDQSDDRPGRDPSLDAEAGPDAVSTPAREPNWWHRDHPTFTALTGFFTGLAFMILVPGVFAAVLNWVFDYHTAENLFPLVLITLVVPIALVAVRRTRRFGRYMLVGMVTTLLVVGGVTALVLWYLFKTQG